MSKIVDLNRFRKDKARAEKTEKAAENRTAHGRTKAEKNAEKVRADKTKKMLDQHRRDGDDGPGAA
jgi:hypothetical protein